MFSGGFSVELMFRPIRKYADFHGRARRAEYWLFALFELLLCVAFVVAFALVSAASGGYDETDPASTEGSVLAGSVLLLAVAAWLGLLLPRLAVMVRRLHDTGNSGWLVLIGLIPLGGLVLFVFSLLDGTAGPNEHGPDPKGRGRPVADAFS